MWGDFPRLKSGKGQRTPKALTKKNQSTPVEAAGDGLWQGNPHEKGVTNSQENGRDSLGLGIGRRNQKLSLSSLVLPHLCCLAPRLDPSWETHRSEQEGSSKHTDPLLLNESHFLSAPCLELSFQMANPGDQTAGRHRARVASR